MRQQKNARTHSHWLGLFATVLLVGHDLYNGHGSSIVVNAQLLPPGQYYQTSLAPLPTPLQPYRQSSKGLQLQDDSPFSYQENAFGTEDSENSSDSMVILEEQARLALEMAPSLGSPLSEPQLIGANSVPFNSTWRLWYRSPAKSIEQDGFLLGNSRNQVLVGGHINIERLILSEESCWTGGPGSVKKSASDKSDGTSEDEFEYRGGNVAEDKAQERQQTLHNFRLALEEKHKISPSMPIAKSLQGDERGFGRPVSFGEILIEELHAFGKVEHYLRVLDLETGVAKVSFTVDDVEYTREHFCSFPDSICIVRMQASQPKSMNIKVSLNSHHDKNVQYGNVHNRLGFRTQLESNNMTIEALIAVKTEGPTGVSMANSRQVVALGFNAITLYYSVGTSWSASSFPTFEGKDPHDRLVATVEKATTMFYGDQFQKHVQDHQSLFSGFNLDLGFTENPRSTSELIEASHKGRAGEEESYLDALIVQYSRYLLIASSRPGSLPLSGQSAWSAADDSKDDLPSNGYKMNVNLQMNYWLAESTGLGETVTPLIDYMENLLVPRGQDTAKLHHGARGWVTHSYSNIWAHTGPTAQETSFYFPAASAWLCQHAWDRYLYGQDYSFLRDHAYKLMKGASQFWLDTLVQSNEDNGIFLTSPSYSPEHGPFTKGSALDQQLLTQLFNNTLEAIAIVGERDKVFVQNLTTTLASLAPGLKIGGVAGHLQEWDLDLDDPNERHYHMAPFWAVYPGHRIFIPNESADFSKEELLKAARTALLNRGMAVTEGNFGWAKSWRAAVWVRLGDGAKAAEALDLFKKNNVKYSNMLDFNEGLSGQLGMAAAIVEMVVQSRTVGSIEILTAVENGLPERWLKRGTVQGFRTRDGHSISVSWEEAKVRNVEILAALKAAVVDIKIGSLKGEEETPSEKVHVSIKGNNKVPVYSRVGDTIVLTMSKGQTYIIQIDSLLLTMSESTPESRTNTGNPHPKQSQQQQQQQQDRKNKPASSEGTSTDAKSNANPNSHPNPGNASSANNTPQTSGSTRAGPSSNSSSPRTSRSKRTSNASSSRGSGTPKSPSMRSLDSEGKQSGESVPSGSSTVTKAAVAQKDSDDGASQLKSEAIGTVGLGVASGGDTKTEQSSYQSPYSGRRGGFGKTNGDRSFNSSRGGYGGRGEGNAGGDDENFRERRFDRRPNRSDAATSSAHKEPTATTSTTSSKQESDSSRLSTSSNATSFTSGDVRSHQQPESLGVSEAKKSQNAARSPRSPRSPRRGFGERGMEAKNEASRKGASPSPRPKKDNISGDNSGHKNELNDSGSLTVPSSLSNEPIKKRKPAKKNKKRDDDDVSTVSTGSARDADVSTEDKESTRHASQNHNGATGTTLDQPAETPQESNSGGSSSSAWVPKSKVNRPTHQQHQQRPHGPTDDSRTGSSRSTAASSAGSHHTFDSNSSRNRREDTSYSNKGNYRSQNNNNTEFHRSQQENSSSFEAKTDNKAKISDEGKGLTPVQDGWNDPPVVASSGGWGEAANPGLKWNEEPSKTSSGGWGEKPTQTGSEGWGEKPAKTGSEGWGDKPVKTGSEGWGEKPAKTGNEGWNEKPARTGNEGWGEPATKLKWGEEVPWEARNPLKPLSDPEWNKESNRADKTASGESSSNSNRSFAEGNQMRTGGGRGKPFGESDSRFAGSQQGYQRGGKRPQGPDSHPRDARSSFDARNVRPGLQRGPRPSVAKDNTSVGSSDANLAKTASEPTTATQGPASGDAVVSPPVRRDATGYDAISERREAPFDTRRQPSSLTGTSDVRLDPRYNNRQSGPRAGQRPGAFSSQYRQGNVSSSSMSPDLHQNGPPAKGKFDQAGKPRKAPKDRDSKEKGSEQRYVPMFSDSLECQMTWKEMNLSPNVLASILKAGLDKPSNVQKLVMKPFEQGRDVIAQSQSQNDRTNTLAIALLQKLSPTAATQKHCQAIVVCPEGINPQKVHEDFESWFEGTPGLQPVLLSAEMVADKTLLSDPEQPKQLILATLGPLMRAIDSNLLDMKTVGTVVISMRSAELVGLEAFKRFWGKLSKDAQVILMTGTIKPQIQMLKMQNFRTNTAVRRADELTMQWSEHYYISIPSSEQQDQLESGHDNDVEKDSDPAVKDRKWDVLMEILSQNPDISHSVILTQSQSLTQALTTKLEAQKLPVLSVWSMADKTEVARQFNRPDPCILVSESILMDNLDLDYSSLVINYEMPKRASHYISSFGPFGRSGLRTLMINFCSTDDAAQKQTLQDMESIYDIKIQEMKI
ncbi:hypothetical protein BGX27_009431 [Mortierella sp. AM989]|nr:hypothetical protein BGX27_009431 [Mortierella sp. AM989]